MPSTPALELDLDRLERNIAAMTAFTTSMGLSLRPHVKTHKCIDIARMQVDAGAAGITVATIGEAEVFAEAGFDDIFIAFPLWLDYQAGQRLLRLCNSTRIRIGTDSAEGSRQIAKALGGRRGTVEVAVEVNSGHGRSGAEPSQVDGVASAACDAGLTVVGAFTYPGHGYAPHGRGGAAIQEAAAMRIASTVLSDIGLPPTVLSGGSTPTGFESDARVLTEIRPGVYVFNDAQQWELESCSADDIALVARATVVSRRGSRAILDAGSKIIGADRPAWVTGHGRLLDHPSARIVALSEHHATVDFGADPPPMLGELVRVVPNHVCTAVNLVDTLRTTRSGLPQGTWNVDARGAF